MSKYYCHECMMVNSIVTPASPIALTGTQYQLDKFIKHTAPSQSYPLNSVFDDPTYKAYSKYVVSTSASGLLEIDDQGRNNLMWFAGSRTGAEYRNGVFTAPTEGVKVVWPESGTKLHAFPITGSPHRSVNCASCGKALPLW